jgi:CheY-like chemotaxis protein
VLVIDDHASCVRSFTAELLEDFAATVTAVPESPEALEPIRT